jgi:predicted nucleic acid-binding protein
VSNLEDMLKYNEERSDLKNFIIRESSINKYIVDASVALKWYYRKNEDDLEKADMLYGYLWSDKDILMAPELLVYEILNTLRLKKDLAFDDVKKVISNIYQVMFLLDTDKEFLEKAFEYSRKFDISLYDSIYITFSEKYDAPLITADKNLFDACKEIKHKPILVSEFGKSQK